MPLSSSRGRSLALNGLLVLIAFGLLGLVVYQKRDQVREVLSRPLDARLFALAFGLYLAGIIGSFYRWYRLVRVIEPRFTLRGSVVLGFIGNVFNLVIPGAVGGDFIKAAYLVRMDINRTQALASMVIDRIVGLLGLFVLAGVAGAVAWPGAGPKVRALVAIVWCAVAAGFFVLGMIFNQSLTRRRPALLDGPGRRARLVRELNALSKTYRASLGLIAGCLAGSTLIHATFVVAFYLVSLALFPGGVPGLGQHLLMVPLTLFTTAVPLPFGALGLSEAVGERLFLLLDYPNGSLAMMGFRVLMYGGGLVSACVYLANLRQVRALTATAAALRDEALGEPDDDPAPTPGPLGPAFPPLPPSRGISSE